MPDRVVDVFVNGVIDNIDLGRIYTVKFLDIGCSAPADGYDTGSGFGCAAELPVAYTAVGGMIRLRNTAEYQIMDRDHRRYAAATYARRQLIAETVIQIYTGAPELPGKAAGTPQVGGHASERGIGSAHFHTTALQQRIQTGIPHSMGSEKQITVIRTARRQHIEHQTRIVADTREILDCAFCVESYGKMLHGREFTNNYK